MTIIDQYKGVKLAQQGDRFQVIGPRGGILASTPDYGAAQDVFNEEINKRECR